MLSGEKNKLLKIFIVALVFILFLLVGSFKLDKFPNTLNQDEMIFALGAKKLSETGYDLCEKKMPLFPCQSKEWPYQGVTISHYLSSLFYKLYSPSNIFEIRIYGVLIGAIAGIIFLFFANAILFEVKNRFIYSTLFSIIFYFSVGIFTIQRFGAPYWILSILLQLILFFLIYKFYITKKEIFMLFIPIVAALLMLDYQLYRFFAPLYLLFFILFFRKNIWNKYFFIGLVIFVVISLFVFSQTIGDIFTKNFYLRKVISFNILDLFYYPLISFYFKYQLPFFSSNNYGFFQSFSIIFFLAGLVWVIQNIKKNNFSKFVLFSLLTFPLAGIIVSGSFASNRNINLIPVYFIICLYGFLFLKKYLEKKLIFPFLSKVLLGILFLFILGQGFYFIRSYFYGELSKQNSCKTDRGYNCNFIGLFDYLKKNNLNKIYFDSSIIFINSYIDFFNKIMNHNIKNYAILNIETDTLFEKNSIIVISKNKSKALEEEKYNLIHRIDEPNIQDKFFYIFKTN